MVILLAVVTEASNYMNYHSILAFISKWWRESAILVNMINFACHQLVGESTFGTPLVRKKKT